MGYNFFQIKQVKESFNRKLNDFIFSLGPAITEGKEIPFADNDITYTLKLQHERLREKGLDMDYEVYTSDKNMKDFIEGSTWSDAHYESAVCFRSVGVKRLISRNGQKLYKDKRRNIIYETVTDVLTGSHPDDVTICCPNCGGLSKLSELQNGCEYCGTKYKMDDLFPRVTSYFFLEDFSMDEDEFKKKLFLTMGGCALFIIIGNLILHPEQFANIFGIIGLLIMGPFCGAIFGYIFFSMFLFGKLIVKSISSLGKMGTVGSRRKFESRTKYISPEFSFEYFTSKAISLIKNTIYSKNETELPFYDGVPIDPDMKNIIDLNYAGALGLEKFKDEGNIVSVVTDAYFDVLYAKNDKVFMKHKIFTATFKRRTDIPVNFHFSITRIACPTCGSSFDATKNKFCPGCGNEYHMMSDDWVLTEIRYK